MLPFCYSFVNGRLIRTAIPQNFSKLSNDGDKRCNSDEFKFAIPNIQFYPPLIPLIFLKFQPMPRNLPIKNGKAFQKTHPNYTKL